MDAVRISHWVDGLGANMEIKHQGDNYKKVGYSLKDDDIRNAIIDSY
jgi:hypothetical protein